MPSTHTIGLRRDHVTYMYKYNVCNIVGWEGVKFFTVGLPNLLGTKHHAESSNVAVGEAKENSEDNWINIWVEDKGDLAYIIRSSIAEDEKGNEDHPQNGQKEEDTAITANLGGEKGAIHFGFHFIQSTPLQ